MTSNCLVCLGDPWGFRDQVTLQLEEFEREGEMEGRAVRHSRKRGLCRLIDRAAEWLARVGLDLE